MKILKQVYNSDGEPSMKIINLIKHYLRAVAFWWGDLTHNNWREYAQSDHDYNVAKRKQRRS